MSITGVSDVAGRGVWWWLPPVMKILMSEKRSNVRECCYLRMEGSHIKLNDLAGDLTASGVGLSLYSERAFPHLLGSGPEDVPEAKAL